jgi:transcriptional regulator with XRE-family HTH domain
MTKVGERIRGLRLERGLSQGDIEQRTGLLRCYLSRVENGHTTPSLQTLTKIARALEMPLAGFFSEANGAETTMLATAEPPALSNDELAFLSQIRRYSASLNDEDRRQVVAMVKRMATGLTQ